MRVYKSENESDVYHCRGCGDYVYLESKLRDPIHSPHCLGEMYPLQKSEVTHYLNKLKKIQKLFTELRILLS